MRSLHLAYLAASVLPFGIQLAGAIEWDRPKDDPFAHTADVVYTDNSFNDTFPPVEGAPASDDDAPVGPDAFLDSVVTAASAKDFYLRVMPLGASITRGQASTDNTGYRKSLRQKLRYQGWQVNMVGSRQDGDMNDNDNEGWSGYVINSIYAEFMKSAHLKPNLVLVNAGTNDCGDNGDGANAARDMKSMLDGIYASIDGVTVILSSLMPSTKNPTCATFVSEQYRQLATQYSDHRFGFADIHAVFPINLLHDDTHPNDEGYRLFAAVWWEAIRKLEDVIQPPQSNGQSDDAISGNTCRKVAGNSKGSIKTQVGSGHNDGNYVHASEAQGVLSTARIEYKNDNYILNSFIPSRIFFANLIKTDPNADRSQALDDWIRVWNGGTDSKSWVWNVRQNMGNGVFGDSQVFHVDQECEQETDARYGWDFADFNGDELADLFCFRKDGSVGLSLNQGGNPPTFKFYGQIIGGIAPDDWDYQYQRYQFADIDGDGRADFCIFSPNTVKCSRNGGQGNEHFWQGFKDPGTIRDLVFSHDEPGIPTINMRLQDINGDGRADFMYITDNGAIKTWVNNRSTGKSIVPTFRSAGQTHAGQAENNVAYNVKLGRIYGSGRLDYLFLVIDFDKDYIDIKAWKNTGGGGTKLNGDGSFFCDMRGTGSDDLVWIYDSGMVDEVNTNIHSPPQWGHDTKISFSVPGPRTGIHLADWDGDGRCDVLVQDRLSGALTLWHNNYDKTANSITFTSQGVVARPGCAEGWGPSIFNRGMRLADLDGDGRADITCLENSGRITGWLNRASGMLNVGQIKYAEAWDRANLRLADVEASGRADIIWLNKYTGAATVFKNLGYKGVGGGPGGSSFQWENRGVLYSPIDRGETMNFANLGGKGRADLIHIIPSTNAADTNFNECSSGAGGDDGPITDPNLPSVPTTPGDGDDDDGYLVAQNPTVITVAPYLQENAPPPAEVTENATPIDINGKQYFWLDNDCNDGDNIGEYTRREFMTHTINDALFLLENLRDNDWRIHYPKSADYYIGETFALSKQVADFDQNIKDAADWPRPVWGWGNYVRVHCTDWDKRCGNRLGTDRRSIGAYINETSGFWGTYYHITVCNPLWQTSLLDQVVDEWRNTPTNDLGLDWMRTSADVFMHEIMHLSVATGKRKKILDQLFDGGRRIYGPKDVARAARIAKRDGFDIQAYNADTYAVFALSAYYEDVFGVRIPADRPRAASFPVDAYEYDAPSDSSTNYVIYQESS